MNLKHTAARIVGYASTVVIVFAFILFVLAAPTWIRFVLGGSNPVAVSDAMLYSLGGGLLFGIGAVGDYLSERVLN